MTDSTFDHKGARILTRRLSEAVAANDLRAVYREALDPFITPNAPEKVRPLVAYNLGLRSVTYKGNNHRVFWNQVAVSQERKTKVWIPSPDLLDRYVPTYHEPLADGSGTVFKRENLWNDINGVLQDIVEAARECFGLDPKTFYVTVDVTPNPFYGQGASNPLTSSGLMSKPEFHDIEGKATPVFAGTKWGHEFIVLSIHFYESQVTLPVAVFDVPNFDHNVGHAVSQLLERLELVPSAPLFILLDRGFCNIAVFKALNDYCARHPGSYYIVPMILYDSGPKTEKSRKRAERKLAPGAQLQPSIKKFMDEAFGDSGMSRLYKDGSADLYAYTQRYWEGDSSVGFGLAVYYWHEESPAEVAKVSVAVSKDYHATPLATNYPLKGQPDWVIEWFASQYRRRWICENAVFKAYKGHLGRWPTGKVGSRFLGYGLSIITLGLYGLFRREMQAKLGLRLHHPELSLASFCSRSIEALQLQES